MKYMPLKVVNTPPADSGILAEKRAWLRETVARLKREQKLTQKAIGTRVGDTEPEMSGRLKPGGRAITDEWLARFEEEFSVKFQSGPIAAKDPGSSEILAAISRLEQSVSALVNAQVMVLGKLDEILKARN